MATQYDLENLASDLEAVMKNFLNTKLASLDAEKADGMSLLPLDNQAYFFATLDGKEANFNPFIVYGIDDIATDSVGPTTANTVTFNFAIVLIDEGMDLAIVNRMLRYQRALREIFEENWSQSRNGIKLKIQSLVPAFLKGINATYPSRVVGLNVTAVLPD